MAKFDELIVNGIRELSKREKEDKLFIEHVNMRIQKAIEAKKNGKAFYSLEELQREYA